jgi:hypothetical protein
MHALQPPQADSSGFNIHAFSHGPRCSGLVFVQSLVLNYTTVPPVARRYGEKYPFEQRQRLFKVIFAVVIKGNI